MPRGCRSAPITAPAPGCPTSPSARGSRSSRSPASRVACTTSCRCPPPSTALWSWTPARAPYTRPDGLPPAELGSDVVEDALDDVGVVVHAELVGDGEQQRVGRSDRLVLGELLHELLRVGGVR